MSTSIATVDNPAAREVCMKLYVALGAPSPTPKTKKLGEKFAKFPDGAIKTFLGEHVRILDSSYPSALSAAKAEKPELRAAATGLVVDFFNNYSMKERICAIMFYHGLLHDAS
jgi:hypothetical protein